MSTDPTKGRYQPGNRRGSAGGAPDARHRALEPRRVRNGVRLAVETPVALIEADNPHAWVAQSWLAMLDASFSPAVLEEGWRYAKLGQVASIKLLPGRIDAVVQGAEPQPRHVTIRPMQLSDASWRRLINAMCDEAHFTASLISRAMPTAMPQLARQADCALAFGAEEDLEITQARKQGLTSQHRAGAIDHLDHHAAAAAYVIAARLTAEPLLIFLLRGLAIDQLIERLRQGRVRTEAVESSVHADPYIPATAEAPLPLDACVDGYWGSGAAVDALRRGPVSQHAPHALLRRLGPSPLGGKFPLVGLLASVYDHVSQHARALQDEADHVDGESS